MIHRWTYLPLAPIFFLAACGGGGDDVDSGTVTPTTPTLTTGANNGGTGTTPTDALAALNTQASYTATPRAGVEMASIQTINGTATPTIDASPAVTLTRTTTGFEMQVTGGVVAHDTRTGSSNVATTPQTFTSCQTNSACSQAASSLVRFRTTFTRGAASTLTYSTYGTWSRVEGTALSQTGFGAFAVGVPSTAGQVPTTGAATFTGGAGGHVAVNGTDSLIFSGTATFNADFAGRTMSGSITSITTQRVGGTASAGTLGSIALGNGTISGASFSGASLGLTQAGAAVDIGGGVGRWGGSFYGPTAQEAAGTFTLLGNGYALVGAFGARR